MSKANPGQPLRPRLERFAQLLAAPERRTATDAWCLSDDNPIKPAPTKGREVAASRNSNREDVKARVAFLRAERATASEQSGMDADGVAALMERVTGKFLEIGELAARLGLGELAQKMRRSTVVHAGRSERLHRHVPVVEKTETIDVGEMLGRLHLCECST